MMWFIRPRHNSCDARKCLFSQRWLDCEGCCFEATNSPHGTGHTARGPVFDACEGNMRQSILVLVCCMPVTTVADLPQSASVPVTKHCLKEVEETLLKHNMDVCHYAQYMPFTQVNPISPEIVGYVVITEKKVNDPAWADRCRLIFSSKTRDWLNVFARECRSSSTPTVQRTNNLSKDLNTLVTIIELAEKRGETEHHISINHDSIKTKYYFDSPRRAQ